MLLIIFAKSNVVFRNSILRVALRINMHKIAQLYAWF